MERKNIKRNANRQSAKKRPFTQGRGFGGRTFFPKSNITSEERALFNKGLY